MKQNYLRAETLVSANVRLVDFQFTIEVAGSRGGGEVASADCMRFVTQMKTINLGLTENILVPGVASPGTTLSLISTLDSTASLSPAHYVIPFLCWKAF